MAEEECNLDDLMCQLEILRGLRTIEGALGKEGFSTLFPDLKGLDVRIKESIASSRMDLREALAKCGNDDLIEETISQFEPDIKSMTDGEE